MDETKAQLQTILTEIGFSEKEQQVYLALFRTGKGTVSEIAEQSGLKRSILYVILEKLEKAGLVHQLHDESSIAQFQIAPPTALIKLARSMREKAELVEKKLDHLHAELMSEYKIVVNKPTVQYFEGQAGLEAIFRDIYSPKKEPVYGCVDIAAVDEYFQKFILGSMVPDRIQHKLQVETIFTDSPLARSLQDKDAEEYRNCILVDGSEYPLPAEIDIYEDKIAMLSFENDEFVAVLIENKAMADTLRSVFKLAMNTTTVTRIKAVKKPASQNSR